jgi:hypothetical protein
MDFHFAQSQPVLRDVRSSHSTTTVPRSMFMPQTKPISPELFGVENIPVGYRARENYTILSRDEFTERFEIAEPGKDFELYSEARFKRVH